MLCYVILIPTGPCVVSVDWQASPATSKPHTSLLLLSLAALAMEVGASSVPSPLLQLGGPADSCVYLLLPLAIPAGRSLVLKPGEHERRAEGVIADLG